MTFLNEPPLSPAVQARYDADRAAYGFVMNLSHLWGHDPEAHTRLFELLGLVGSAFSFRERGILVTSAASMIGDSYCALAWGWKLGEAGDGEAAAAVLSGSDEGLSPREEALAAWARKVAGGAGATTAADVQELRDAGLGEDEIFRATVFVALRVAFSTVNGALGAQPDSELGALASPDVTSLVTWGRPVAGYS